MFSRRGYPLSRSPVGNIACNRIGRDEGKVPPVSGVGSLVQKQPRRSRTPSQGIEVESYRVLWDIVTEGGYICSENRMRDVRQPFFFLEYYLFFFSLKSLLIPKSDPE